MLYIIMFLLGGFAGAATVYILTDRTRRRLAHYRLRLEDREQQLAEKSKHIAVTQEINEKQYYNKMDDLRRQHERLKNLDEEYIARFISYEELQNENSMLKIDMRNIEIELRKMLSFISSNPARDYHFITGQ